MKWGILAQSGGGSPGSAPVITGHPADVSVNDGGDAVFTCTYTGYADEATWEVSADGVVWVPPSFYSTNYSTNRHDGGEETLTFTAAAVGLDGLQVRVTLSNAYGSAVSNAATLTVTAAPVALPVENGIYDWQGAGYGTLGYWRAWGADGSNHANDYIAGVVSNVAGGVGPITDSFYPPSFYRPGLSYGNEVFYGNLHTVPLTAQITVAVNAVVRVGVHNRSAADRLITASILSGATELATSSVLFQQGSRFLVFSIPAGTFTLRVSGTLLSTYAPLVNLITVDPA